MHFKTEQFPWEHRVENPLKMYKAETKPLRYT